MNVGNVVVGRSGALPTSPRSLSQSANTQVVVSCIEHRRCFNNIRHRSNRDPLSPQPFSGSSKCGIRAGPDGMCAHAYRETMALFLCPTCGAERRAALITTSCYALSSAANSRTLSEADPLLSRSALVIGIPRTLDEHLISRVGVRLYVRTAVVIRERQAA